MTKRKIAPIHLSWKAPGQLVACRAQTDRPRKHADPLRTTCKRCKSSGIWRSMMAEHGKASARQRYERTHWGDPSTETIEADAAILSDGDVLAALGVLHAVEYVTSKAGDDAIYRHEFKEGAEPLLCETPDGDLVIVGGSYRVTLRGIVG